MPETLSQEFRDEVRKQARQQAAKWVIGGGIALAGFAISGWLFAAKPYVDDYIKRTSNVNSIASVPDGAIMAFDRTPSGPCPDGWRRFKEATSRVIVGAGNVEDFYEERFSKDENGRKLSPRAYRQHAGEEVVENSPVQVADHQHVLGVVKLSEYFPGGGLGARDAVSGTGNVLMLPGGAAQNPNQKLKTQAIKNGQPHNNMPPFIALYYCKK
ncbi:MAG: hypothetical protein GY755_08600 [Chloroflexi bacterium]|nr:hypothetical protein [Chloroflexota bacterium]